MNLVDYVPLIVSHVGKGFVPENPGIVDKDINAAVGINSGLDNRLAVLHIRLVSNSFASKILDLFDHIVRVHKIVDNDLGATLSQLQAVDTAETRPTASDKSYLALEVKLLTLGIWW